MLVDTHAHLADQAFERDLPEVLARARSAGVGTIIAVSTDLRSSERCLEIAARHEDIRVAVGIHPSRSDSLDSDGPAVKALLSHSSVCAVGEIGLDFVRQYAPIEVQKTAFNTQLVWAKELGLPVVIHNRGADEDVLTEVREFGGAGVLHCFSASAGVLAEAAALGFFISFAGNVTYPKSDEIRSSAGMVTSERLLIETDSPYLPPQGHRGERNEPANVRVVAEAIATTRGVGVESIAQQTSENAAELFRLEIGHG